jgi:hypothetical protein
MRSIALLVIFSLSFVCISAVQAQEQQCLPADEVERIANERKGFEGEQNRGAVWRYTDLFLAPGLVPDCVIRLTPRKLRIDGQDYYYVGSAERGHWYRIVSIKEERGQIWPGVITDPKEPIWHRVTIDTGLEQIAVLRFVNPIRLKQVPEWVSPVSAKTLKEQLYGMALEGKNAIIFTPLCAIGREWPRDCLGFSPSPGPSLSLALRYGRAYSDFRTDDGFWKEVAALLAAR